MQIRELMTDNPVCCTPNTEIRRVAQLMTEHDYGAIPVIEGNGSRKVLGVITDRDIVSRVIARGSDPDRTPVHEAMTDVTVTVRPGATLDRAAELMRENRLRRLVVTEENGSCIGLVSLADLARRGPEERVGSLLREISEPSEHASAVTS